ncbi:MAG: hypothetical protein HKL91_06735 [Candidatus Eremiobacteraeota bacterium]|uniref:NHL repeat protein n=1 Tax=mine drainage metagenome TaxID=410659 RepID=E6PFD7_9ZZZZ|nr:hypothetical protein [Candidatus Eremiobacteraeota bacterium]
MRRIRRNILIHLTSLRRELAASGLAFALLAGCGGGAGAGMPSHALPSVGGNGTLSLSLHVPSPSLQANRRSPKYVSPDTQYIGISYLSGANQTFTQSQLDAPQVNFAVSSPTVCALQSNGYRFCSVAVSLAPGTYTVGITTWAAPPTPSTFATTSELSQTTLPSEVVTSGISANLGSAASINASLDAIPAGLAVTPLPSQTHVISSGTTYGIIGMSPIDFLVEPIDAAGNIIIGQGAPSVSLAPDSAHDTTVTPNTGNANEFSVQVVAWNSSPLSLTATATPPSGSGLGPSSAILSIQPVQEWWGSYAYAGPLAGLAGFALQPTSGAAPFTPPFTGTGTGRLSTPEDSLVGNLSSLDYRASTVDASGNIWVADNVTNQVIEYGAPTGSQGLVPSGTQLAASPPIAGASGIDLSADSAGNIWLYDSYTGYLEEYSAATGAQEHSIPVSSVFVAPTLSTISDIEAVSNGPLAGDLLIVGTPHGSPYSSLYAVNSPFASPTVTTLFAGTSSASVQEVAVTPAGTLAWMTIVNTTSFTSNLTAANVLSATSLGPTLGSLSAANSCLGISSGALMGFSSAQSLAAAADGSVWVAPAPASYGTACNYALSGTTVSFTGGFVRDASDGAIGITITP